MLSKGGCLCETDAMPKSKKNQGKSNGFARQKNVTLKDVALSLNLSPTAVSLVLNAAPTADSIPKETQERIFEAARRLNYRPNYIARSFRAQRTHTIGVLIPELSGGYASMVLSGVEEKLLEQDFYYLIGSHRHKHEYIERYSRFFVERCVEGILAIDTPQSSQTFLPVVSISGHDEVEGVTNIVLNHDAAARLAVRHLTEHGHEKIAVLKGQEFSSDTEIRFQAILNAARAAGIQIGEKMISQLTGDNPSPEPGYVAAKRLLADGVKFTALIAFNDISAIGAISALREFGLEVPRDVSVVGFDDVYEARFNNPALTTIRQPLRKMGELGAKHLLEKITAGANANFPNEVTVEPELIVRQSTAAAPEK